MTPFESGIAIPALKPTQLWHAAAKSGFIVRSVKCVNQPRKAITGLGSRATPSAAIHSAIEVRAPALLPSEPVRIAAD